MTISLVSILLFLSQWAMLGFSFYVGRVIVKYLVLLHNRRTPFAIGKSNLSDPNTFAAFTAILDALESNNINVYNAVAILRHVQLDIEKRNGLKRVDGFIVPSGGPFQSGGNA